MADRDQPGGAPPPTRHELPQIKDRLSFIYLEYAKISREDSALRADDKDGYILIPSHSFLVLMLGPGCSLTHRAMELLSNSGTAVVWVGQSGLKFYGYGKSLARNSDLLINQAKIVSSPKLHIEAVKKMYGLRFPDENLTGQTLQQLRGKEGSRMRKAYRIEAEKYGIPWNGRRYDPNDFSSGDPVNRALSVANTCLYGLVFAVICGMGLSPGLGVIHTGLEQSLVYDVADLYKTEITIPLCFELAAESSVNIESRVRRKLREKIHGSDLINRIVRDLIFVFGDEDYTEDKDSLTLWDGKRGNVAAGTQYFRREDKGRS